MKVEPEGSGTEERSGSNGRASISKVPAEEQPTLVASLMDQLKSMALRGSIYASFFMAKQPKRIRQASFVFISAFIYMRATTQFGTDISVNSAATAHLHFYAYMNIWSCLQVLEQVYISQHNVDEDLVNSIVWPAESANAAESFYRIISGKGTPVNVLLSKLDKVRSLPHEFPLLCVSTQYQKNIKFHTHLHGNWKNSQKYS